MSNDLKPQCPECGAPLPPDAPAGLCPKCLMGLNLKTETVFTDAPAAAEPPVPTEQLAPHFPQLEILECLGRGGMGVVYKARQKTLNRFVALKLLAPERVNQPEFASRFAREAQALAVLNHPNIVTIHDFGQAGGFYFLIMEFVDGVNLRHLLRTRKFTPEEALTIIPPLCDALQFAHERGIVHRDIKPENILLDKSGRVKVADFGIAKMLGSGDGACQPASPAAQGATQNVVGTRGYCAPEQESSPQRVDSRADIYSLGVVFYEMLTGELPGKPIELPSHKVQIDVRLDEIVLRALEKRPELRYQQASALKTQVETIAHAASTPSAQAFSYRVGYEYKSKRTLFGWPLLHVADGIDPATGEVRRARGIVAIGGTATGVFAFGGRAYGLVAFGGIAVGGLAVGGISAGLVSIGGLTLALLLALGGLAIAPVAIGGIGVGFLVVAGKAFGAGIMDSTHYASGDVRRLIRTMADLNVWLTGPLIALVFAFVLALQGWARKRSQPFPSAADPLPSPRVRITVIGLIALLVLVFAAFMQVGPAYISQKSDLVDNPQDLKTATLAQALQAGMAHPEVPWAWNELRSRTDARNITKDDAVQIMNELTIWLHRKYPHGYDAPLWGLGDLLAALGDHRLVPETNAIEFQRAYAVVPAIEPIPRFSEDERTLQFHCKLRSPWYSTVFGLQVIRDVRNFAVDGTAVPIRSYASKSWELDDFWGEANLPRLAPGTHKFQCEVISAIVSAADVAAIQNTPGAEYSASEWPPAKAIWTTPCEQDFVVSATNTEPVTLVNDTPLNPAAAGVVAVNQIITRAYKGQVQAVLGFNLAPKAGAPLSVNVKLRIGSKIYDGGPLTAIQAGDSRASHTSADKMTVQLYTLDPQIKFADVILSPNARGAASDPDVTNLWAQDIEFDHVALERWDLRQTNFTKFGPIMEVALEMGSRCDFLDLDTGQTYNRRPGREKDLRNDLPKNPFMDWVKARNMDLGFATNDSSGQLELVAFGMGIYPFGKDILPDAERPTRGATAGVTNIWNDLDPNRGLIIEFEPMFENQIFAQWVSGDLMKHPVLFRTREGSIGMFRESRYNTNPPSVTMQYRLIEDQP